MKPLYLFITFLLFIPGVSLFIWAGTSETSSPANMPPDTKLTTPETSMEKDLKNNTNPGTTATEKANEILKRSLEAYGGEKQILANKDATCQYKAETFGNEVSKPITVKSFFKDESLFRSEAKENNLEAITILNGDKGWVKVGDTILDIPSQEARWLRNSMLIQLRPDLLIYSFPKHRFTIKTEEDNRTLVLIEVSGFIANEYVRGRLSIDVKTDLIYKYEYEIERDFSKGKGIIHGEEKYISYKEISGIKVPIEIISKKGGKSSKLIVEHMDFSTISDESLFQDPRIKLTNKK